MCFLVSFRNDRGILYVISENSTLGLKAGLKNEFLVRLVD